MVWILNRSILKVSVRTSETYVTPCFVGCTVIFCQLLYMYPGKAGFLLPWITCSLWCVQIVVGYTVTLRFFPEDSFALQVLSLPVNAWVCLCVSLLYVCINDELVFMITHHPFKQGSPNRNQRCKTLYLKSRFTQFELIDIYSGVKVKY